MRIDSIINLSVLPREYEITKHTSRGRCINCLQLLKKRNIPTDRSGKIIFGDKTKREEIPWHVGITTNLNSLFCGGTLISSSKILTAAHCFQGSSETRGELFQGDGYYWKAVVGNTKACFQSIGGSHIRVIHLVSSWHTLE